MTEEEYCQLDTQMETEDVLMNDVKCDLVKDGLVDASEASQFTGLGKTKLYELMTNGTLPYVKIGAARRIPRRALIELMSQNLVRKPRSRAMNEQQKVAIIEAVESQHKTISFPRLKKWVGATLELTALKLMEEGGELAQAILRGESMDEVVKELLDVAQTATTMMYVLEEQYGVSVDDAVEKHIAKLRRKGYITITENREVKNER